MERKTGRMERGAKLEAEPEPDVTIAVFSAGLPKAPAPTG
jgi:hypothetical protein